jgi:hypothetical protein
VPQILILHNGADTIMVATLLVFIAFDMGVLFGQTKTRAYDAIVVISTPQRGLSPEKTHLPP